MKSFWLHVRNDDGELKFYSDPGRNYPAMLVECIKTDAGMI